MIAKIEQIIKTIEEAGNTVEVIESGNEYVKITALRFESHEQHPLLCSQGQVIFSTSYSSGRTKFRGGDLWPGLGNRQKIRTYQDLRIIIDIYTTRRES